MTRLCFMLAALLLATWTPLAAHTSPNTEIRLDPDEDALVARITVPARDYAAATGNVVANEPAALEQAAEQVARRLSITSEDGQAWLMKVDTVVFTAGAGPADLNAVVTARPLPGAPTQSVNLGWNMFAEDAPGHIAMVVMSGGNTGDVANEETILGALTSRSRTLAVELGGVVVAAAVQPESPVEETGTRTADYHLFLVVGLVIAALIALMIFVYLARSSARRQSAHRQTSSIARSVDG